MNPMILLAGLAAVALAMGGSKKAKAAAPSNGVNVNAGNARIVPSQEDGDSDASEAPSTSQTSVNLGPAVIQSPTQDATAQTMQVTNASTGMAVTKDDATAKKNAQSTADHVRTKQYNYSRPLVAAWQAMAGLTSDGIYGPATVSKLQSYGAKNVNKALFAGAKK